MSLNGRTLEWTKPNRKVECTYIFHPDVGWQEMVYSPSWVQILAQI